MFMGLLARIEPASAYLIGKIFARSPVSNFGVSKGKIYPLIERLERRGLIERSTPSSEALLTTQAGREAIRGWLKGLKPSHFITEDPLRMRLQSFDLLSREEQLQWIVAAKEGLRQKLAELENYTSVSEIPFKDLIWDSAASSIRSRLDWLDKVLAQVVRAP